MWAAWSSQTGSTEDSWGIRWAKKERLSSPGVLVHPEGGSSMGAMRTDGLYA